MTIVYRVLTEEIYDSETGSPLGELHHLAPSEGFQLEWEILEQGEVVGRHAPVFDTRESAEAFVREHVEELIASWRLPYLRVYA